MPGALPRRDGVSNDAQSPVAIICGGGPLPFAVADAVQARGRGALLLAIERWADPVALARYPHHWIALGQLGRCYRLARAAGCRDVVCIGTLSRPAASQIKLDWATIRALPRILKSYRGGDDNLLTGIGRIFESEGFRVVGAHEVAPEILMPRGLLGRWHPSARDQADIARALALLAATGPFDVGQAAVIANGHILALEAVEGTDRMLQRIADLRVEGRIPFAAAGTGVLVKAPKSLQDRRYDLPTVGPVTIEHAARAGLAGVAVTAGDSIIVDAGQVASLADAANVFVVGVDPHGQWQ